MMKMWLRVAVLLNIVIFSDISFAMNECASRMPALSDYNQEIADRLVLAKSEVLHVFSKALNRIDEHGSTPMHYAVCDSMITSKTIDLLVTLGARMDIKNHMGISPNDLRLSNRNRLIGERLAVMGEKELSEHCDRFNRIDEYGETPMNYLVKCEGVTIEKMEALIGLGALFTINNDKGRVPYDGMINCKGHSPAVKEKSLYYGNSKVREYLFQLTLAEKLEQLKKDEKFCE